MEGNLHAPPAHPDRNLALELVRVTEAAALAAARWVGHGDKIAADQAAVDAMRFVSTLSRWTASSSSARARRTKPRCSTTASRSATAARREVDIAVDPLEGTTLTAQGFPERPFRHRALRARHDVRPGPVRLHGEDAAGTDEIADLLDLDRPHRRDARAGRRRARAKQSATSS